MKFRKYSSLENHYREKVIAFYRLNGKENVPYVLTEKVHGANFSFWTDGNEVKVASRNQFVDENFYGCGEVIERYSERIAKLYTIAGTAALEESVEVETLAIYGELYGPGVQKGVRYGSEKDFVAFDILIDGVYVDYSALKFLCGLVDIPVVPKLAVVSCLSEALEYDNTFVSLLGKEKGIDAEDNIAEGFVAKPFCFSDQYIDSERVILKSKTEKFTEKQKSPKAKRNPSEPDPLIPLVEPYVNANRLDAVVSKMGPLTPKDFGTVIKAMCEDVIEDMVKDGDVPADWRGLDEYKGLGKSANKVVVPFLKAELLPKL